MKTLPPKIGQLKTGAWAIFNMEGTPFWDKVFTGARAEYDAFWALLTHYEKQGLTRWQSWCKAEEARK